MIKINSIEYRLEELECRWGKFTRFRNSAKKTGIAPRMFFFVGEEDDSKEILLELTITDEEFKTMPLKKELDMESEITDIGYADDEGWLTLSGDKCTFKVTRLEEDKFLFNFHCKDDFKEIDFEIDEEITLEYPKKN